MLLEFKAYLFVHNRKCPVVPSVGWPMGQLIGHCWQSVAGSIHFADVNVVVVAAAAVVVVVIAAAVAVVVVAATVARSQQHASSAATACCKTL